MTNQIVGLDLFVLVHRNQSTGDVSCPQYCVSGWYEGAIVDEMRERENDKKSVIIPKG